MQGLLKVIVGGCLLALGLTVTGLTFGMIKSNAGLSASGNAQVIGSFSKDVKISEDIDDAVLPVIPIEYSLEVTKITQTIEIDDLEPSYYHDDYDEFNIVGILTKSDGTTKEIEFNLKDNNEIRNESYEREYG